MSTLNVAVLLTSNHLKSTKNARSMKCASVGNKTCEFMEDVQARI